jgi:trk system potassium uptake protein
MTITKYIVIVGCGRLGSRLANQLSRDGHSVVVIDKEKRKLNNLSAEFSGFHIHQDATELETLRAAKIHQADIVLALTGADNVNLMVAQVAQTIFEVPKVLARIFDPQREQVYRELGVLVVSPVQLSANAILQVLEESL